MPPPFTAVAAGDKRVRHTHTQTDRQGQESTERQKPCATVLHTDRLFDTTVLGVQHQTVPNACLHVVVCHCSHPPTFPSPRAPLLGSKPQLRPVASSARRHTSWLQYSALWRITAKQAQLHHVNVPSAAVPPHTHVHTTV